MHHRDKNLASHSHILNPFQLMLHIHMLPLLLQGLLMVVVLV
jgi:hypothetical protein